MPSERWRNCTEIFNAAVERPHNARAALLEQRCQDDEALRRKVELLLKYHEHANDLIDTPAFVVAPELLVDDPDARVGQQLGSYQIEGVLGAGGMGIVYLACDERLGRKVGLKLLPQSLLAQEARWERLKHEARTASALNHPNIMTIHEFGEVESTHYIATEFIEGTTLRERMTRGPVPPEEAVDIGRQIASALCVAHGAGVVHRDIKPENIMLRPDGYVKVLDFGIASFSQQEAFVAGASDSAGMTTNQGIIRGTARYMSPEHARGETVDARSDLWSLGVVLYEMLAGRPPFEGKTASDVMAAVFLKDPEPLDRLAPIVPSALRSVVERSVRKDPAQRYQTAEEMLANLRAIETKIDGSTAAENPPHAFNRPAHTSRWSAIAALAVALAAIVIFYARRDGPVAPTATLAPSEKSVAVLPFENLSSDMEDAFFADGIQDDVLTGVGKIKGLKVIARGSVMDYRGARLAGKIREVGQTLGVSHVLEGSVRRVADRVVVNVALIETHNERRVWAERYERTLTDAISLQGELAIEIARALQTKLTPAEALTAAVKPTENPEAYLLYLRGREVEITSYTPDKVEMASQLYQQALVLDPKFALARARLSLCTSMLFMMVGSLELKAKARSEAEEALRLQPQLGEARLALTHCYLWGDRDYERALVALARTAELLPNSAEVPLTAAFIYRRQDRYRDRFAALRRAETLDPRNTKVLSFLGTTHRWVREWRDAMHVVDRTVALRPVDSAYPRWRVRANDEFRLTGDINVLKKAIAQEEARPAPVGSDSLNETGYETAMFERDYNAAAQFLSALPPEAFLPASFEAAHSKAFHEALLAVASDAEETARYRALEVAGHEAETRLIGKDGNSDSKAYADLALLNAFLGRKAQAVRAALRAVELAAPLGVIDKNDLSASLAMVYAQTGEPEMAIDLIEHLLTVPADLQRGAVYNMTLTDLKWRWQWDPLRSHPRFQKLLADPEPKTVY